MQGTAPICIRHARFLLGKRTPGGAIVVGPEKELSRGFEPRSLDSESRVLTVTPREQLLKSRSREPFASGDHLISSAGMGVCTSKARNSLQAGSLSLQIRWPGGSDTNQAS